MTPKRCIKPLPQTNEDARVMPNKFDVIHLSYGLDWGDIETPFGQGVFTEMLNLTLKDTFTSWEWESRIRYDHIAHP